MARIGDQTFIRKLQAILQVKGGRELPDELLDQLVVAIMIPGDQVLENVRLANIGLPISQSPGNPALGADFTFTVPPNKVWAPLSLHARLDTDATAGMREPILAVRDTGAIEFIGQTTTHEQAANLSFGYTWARGIPREIDTSIGRVNQAMPEIILLPGLVFRIITSNIKAGDQWSEGRLLVIEGAA